MSWKRYLCAALAFLFSTSILPGCAPAVQPAPPPEAAEQNSPESAPAEEKPASLDDQVKDILKTMTREQKIAQLFFVSPEAITGGSGSVTAADDALRAAFEACPVGGMILSEGNLLDPAQTKALLSELQEMSREVLDLPVFLGVDEEGGTVARISGTGRFGIDALPDMARVSNEADARHIGEEMGTYLRELGFNLDFAPVADVLTEAENTVVRRRAFSDNPEAVTMLCAAFSEGLQSKGVLACYKHFPGHGATAEDSHKGFACSMHTPEELFLLDLPPFRDAVSRDIPFVMVGHITLPNVTRQETPASLSHEITTELLRGELGFRGVTITDSLDMGAVTKQYSCADAAVQALLAGQDMLLVSRGFPDAYEAVTRAVADGTIPQARLNEAVERILRAKLTWQAEQS